ncbi:MAG: serine acetyltransferase [Oscillospiraceae bacterium]|nr:serine acetyltransferase [Oscillospiraceae bacterium]
MHKLEERIDGVMGRLLEDYQGGRTVDEVKTFDLPDNDVLEIVLRSLQRIIFPGYFRNKAFKVYTVRNNISMLLEDVIYKLTKQIAIVLRYDPQYEHASEEIVTERAEELTFAFLDQIPKIRDFIETDVQAAFDGDPAAYSKTEIIYSYPGLYAIMVNRIAHEFFLLGVPMIPRIMTELAHSKTGIDIHPGASIGRYFFIDHGTGIVIGETTEIGEHVRVYQGVTLGALSTRGGQSLRGKKRHPTIEDNVTIYSGASILGGETVVGHDAVIGGNAFITKSVPAGARVSIRQQELHFHFDDKQPAPAEKEDVEQDEAWFYVI